MTDDLDRTDLFDLGTGVFFRRKRSELDSDFFARNFRMMVHSNVVIRRESKKRFRMTKSRFGQAEHFRLPERFQAACRCDGYCFVFEDRNIADEFETLLRLFAKS